MKYGKIFDYIINRADVRELESILHALHHTANLSPTSLVIFSEVIKKAFSGKKHPAKVKDTLVKTKTELAIHIYF
jgi:hypothetical protein